MSNPLAESEHAVDASHVRVDVPRELLVDRGKSNEPASLFDVAASDRRLALDAPRHADVVDERSTVVLGRERDELRSIRGHGSQQRNRERQRAFLACVVCDRADVDELVVRHGFIVFTRASSASSWSSSHASNSSTDPTNAGVDE